MLRRIIGLVLVAVAVSATASAQERLKPGETFRDCPECPEMVVIPAGSFTMHMPTGGAGVGYDDEDEGPRHRVTIRRAFALGKYGVTFAEWDACVRAGGCTHWPTDEGRGRGNRPVIYVNWNDAHEYVRWLARKTGRDYRLPSEAEFENAGRQPDTYGLHGTTPWEVVEDCWNDSYDGAPSDGSAWTAGDCNLRVLRRGSWTQFVEGMRTGRGGSYASSMRYGNMGFRIARTLP